MAKKKVYRRPEVSRVKLTPEEAVLTSCKRGTGAGKASTCDKNVGVCTASAAGS